MAQGNDKVVFRRVKGKIVPIKAKYAKDGQRTITRKHKGGMVSHERTSKKIRKEVYAAGERKVRSKKRFRAGFYATTTAVAGLAGGRFFKGAPTSGKFKAAVAGAAILAGALGYKERKKDQRSRNIGRAFARMKHTDIDVGTFAVRKGKAKRTKLRERR